ncbi:transmembrane protease serine 5-like [Glandiceps talaboti]
MSVEFTTDGSVEFFGFDAVWVARDQPIECDSEVAYRCGDNRNGYCIPIEERCDGKQDCALGEDEIGCPDNSFRCGRPAIDPNLNATTTGINVVGGAEAERGSWPWVPDPFETVHDVEEIFIHPNYSPLKEEWNFALLKVRGIIGFINDYHLDVCLPGKDDIFPGGTEGWITGWGDTSQVIQSDIGPQDTGSNVLLQTSVTVYSDDYCNDPLRHNGDVTESLTCAGENDGCTGDDGGAMVWYRPDGGFGNPDDDRWYLVGIIGDRTSDGFNCANPDKPGLYSYVPSAVDWIEDTLIAN